MSGKQYGDRLADYVEVKDRIRLFYEAYPDGRLITARVKVTDRPDGKPRVWVKALAYRGPEDLLPAHGWSWMELPGRTPYTNGSELENTETSAWGRAIGALGIGIERSIASAQEVRNKEGEALASPTQDPLDGLIGVAEKGTGRADFELRVTPTGHRLEFRLSQGKQRLKVIALDGLAQLIAEYREGIEGQRVTCWGAVSAESFQKEGKTIRYQVLNLDRIKSGDLDFTEPEPQEGNAPTEAESIELGMLAFPDPVPA